MSHQLESKRIYLIPDMRDAADPEAAMASVLKGIRNQGLTEIFSPKLDEAGLVVARLLSRHEGLAMRPTLKLEPQRYVESDKKFIARVESVIHEVNASWMKRAVLVAPPDVARVIGAQAGMHGDGKVLTPGAIYIISGNRQEEKMTLL